MTAKDLSRMVSESARRLEELQAKCISNAEYEPKALEDALKSLWKSVEELSAAEKLQEESEEKFKVLSNASPVAVIVYRDHKHLYVNSAVISIFGYTMEELLTMDFLDLVHPDYRDMVTRRAQARMGGEEKQARYEVLIITKAGEEKWLDVSTNLIRYDGSPAGIVICTDITEQKKAEAALREAKEELEVTADKLTAQNKELFSAQSALQKSEEKFRLVADFTYDWETWLGLDGNYIYISPSCERITGYCVEEFMKNPLLCLNIVHPDDRAAFEHHRSDYVSNRINKGQIDFRIIKADGETRWMNHLCQPVFGKNGEWLGRRESNRDITERKRAEEALCNSEEQLRSIFESTQEAIIIVDDDMRCTSANPGAGAVTGMPHEQLIGQLLPDFLDPGFDLSIAWSAFLRKGRFSGEAGIRHKDGTFRAVEATGIANILPGQHLFVGHDITERKRAEEAIDAERKQLLSIFESINEIIYISDMDTYKILYANAAAQRFFGEELIGKLCHEALQGKDTPCDFCTNPIIRRLNCQPYLWEFHNPLVDKDFQIVDRIIQWPDGRDVRFEIAIDVTERKKMEEELRRSRDELELRV